jgi:hypothetical protein
VRAWGDALVARRDGRAAEVLERWLALAPDAPDAGEVRAQVARLRGR